MMANRALYRQRTVAGAVQEQVQSQPAREDSNARPSCPKENGACCCARAAKFN